MPRTRSFDDAAVVRAAREVFWVKGYPDTSISDLEEATGLNRSSIYSAFGSKRKLFDRVVEDFLENVTYPTLVNLESEGAGLHGWRGTSRSRPTSSGGSPRATRPAVA